MYLIVISLFRCKYLCSINNLNFDFIILELFTESQRLSNRNTEIYRFSTYFMCKHNHNLHNIFNICFFCNLKLVNQPVLLMSSKRFTTSKLLKCANEIMAYLYELFVWAMIIVLEISLQITKVPTSFTSMIIVCLVKHDFQIPFWNLNWPYLS